MPRGSVCIVELWVTGPSLLRGSESPCSKSPTAVTGVLRRQKRPSTGGASTIGLPRTMLLGSVDVVQLQQWSEQHCLVRHFGFSDYCPHTCTVSATALAGSRSVLEMVRLTHIPGTMSLESVGVLKLQACRPTHLGGQVRPLQQNANGCTVGVWRPGAS
jgi:hypothetical protein